MPFDFIAAKDHGRLEVSNFDAVFSFKQFLLKLVQTSYIISFNI